MWAAMVTMFEMDVFNYERKANINGPLDAQIKYKDVKIDFYLLQGNRSLLHVL